MVQCTVLIAGTDDIATACAIRLFRSGFSVILAALDQPIDIHHQRTFSSALYSGSKTIEKITARTISNAFEQGSIQTSSDAKAFIEYQLLNGEIPVVTKDDYKYLHKVEVDFLVVAEIPIYENLRSIFSDDIPVIALSRNVGQLEPTYFVYSQGAYTGRVSYPFLDSIDSTTNDLVIHEKVEYIKAPIEGLFVAEKSVNDRVHQKNVLGKIADIPILSPESGQISGLLNSGIIVKSGTIFCEINKARDLIDARIIPQNKYCIAGGILEAICYHRKLREGK